MSWINKTVQDILVSVAEKIIFEAKANLKDGPLKKSLKHKLDTNNNSIDIIMNDYGVFKDKGVTGANNPDYEGKRKTVHSSLSNFKFSGGKKAIKGTKSLEGWMKRRGITKDKEFAIRRSVYQHGIKPSLFLTRPYEKYRQEIAKEFNKALSKEAVKNINKDG